MDIISQLQEQVNSIAAITFNAFGTLQRDAPPVQLSPNYPEPPANETTATDDAATPFPEQPKELSAGLVKAAKQFDALVAALPLSEGGEEAQLQRIAELQVENDLIGQELQEQLEAAGSLVKKSEEEWRAVLSPEQFRILRQKGTEKPGTGEYDKFFEKGIFTCVGCKTPLYKSTTKFDAGCGWPAFFEGLPGAINRTPDPDGRRTEITCAACDGHLGHVFKGEGYGTPTDERHCVNSVAISFKTAAEST